MFLTIYSTAIVRYRHSGSQKEKYRRKKQGFQRKEQGLRRKKQGFRRLEQGSEKNRIEIGIPKVIDIDYNTIAPSYSSGMNYIFHLSKMMISQKYLIRRDSKWPVSNYVLRL